MKRILDFYGFGDSNLLNENMKMARDYAIKKYAEEHKIKPSELTDSEREKIIYSKSMNRIKELTEDFPGYAPLFAMFHYDQGAPLGKLEELKNEMTKYKSNLSDLPMTPMEYSKIKKDDKNPTTGYQQLIDDLAKIENKIKLRKLYKAFTSRMRDEFKKATPGEINQLEEISNQLDSLPDVEAVLPDGGKITQNAWGSFTSNLRKYDDLKTYPEFSNPKFAFQELINDAETLIKTWGLGITETVDRLKKAGVEAGIIYVGKGYIVLSARTASCLRIVAGSTTWCIRNHATFKSIVSGGIQLCLLNFNLSSTDGMSLVGLTLDAHGNIVDNANRGNVVIAEALGTKYDDFMWKHGYPKAAIAAIRNDFKEELEIKRFTDIFITGGEISKNFVSKIFGSKAALIGGETSDKAYEILGDILIKLDKGIVKEMISEYKGHGICSEFSLELFKNIFVKYCDASDIKGILEETEFARDDSKLIIKKADKFSEDYVKQAKITIKSVDTAIEYLNGIK